MEQEKNFDHASFIKKYMPDNTSPVGIAHYIDNMLGLNVVSVSYDKTMPFMQI